MHKENSKTCKKQNKQKQNKKKKCCFAIHKEKLSFSFQTCSFFVWSVHTTPGHLSLKKGSTKGQKIKQNGESALSVVFKVGGKEGSGGSRLLELSAQPKECAWTCVKALEVQTAGSG